MRCKLTFYDKYNAQHVFFFLLLYVLYVAAVVVIVLVSYLNHSYYQMYTHQYQSHPLMNFHQIHVAYEIYNILYDTYSRL